jgi:hypothetical protein
VGVLKLSDLFTDVDMCDPDQVLQMRKTNHEEIE